MRLAGKAKQGFYPRPVAEPDRVRQFLQFAGNSFAAADTCVGDGVEFAAVTTQAYVLRYGMANRRRQDGNAMETVKQQ